MEEKLEVSTVKIQSLQKEFERFKNKQLREHTTTTTSLGNIPDNR